MLGVDNARTVPALTANSHGSKKRVRDGIRTRDPQDHNLVL